MLNGEIRVTHEVYGTSDKEDYKCQFELVEA